MKLFLVGVFVAAVLLGISIVFSPRREMPSTGSTISPTVTPQPSDMVLSDSIISVVFDEQSLIIHARVIPESARMTLVANFTGRESAERLVEHHECTAAINGGFYTEERNPLGWFLSEGSQAGQLIKSNLVTGFFWQDTDGKRHISRTAPSKGEVDFVLQTGPYMDVRDQQLKLISDEPARRSLLGIDSDDRIYMLSVIQQENTFSGPLLADLPVLFNTPQVQEAIPFRTLLNLDGGTASFFYNSNGQKPFLLSEIKPIGSLLCIR